MMTEYDCLIGLLQGEAMLQTVMRHLSDLGWDEAAGEAATLIQRSVLLRRKIEEFMECAE